MFKSSVAQGQVLGGSRALLSKTQDTVLESQGVNFVSIVEVTEQDSLYSMADFLIRGEDGGN
jgi:hypothetical protein